MEAFKDSRVVAALLAVALVALICGALLMMVFGRSSDPLDGTIVSHNASSITVALADGTTKQIKLSPQLRLQELIEIGAEGGIVSGRTANLYVRGGVVTILEYTKSPRPPASQTTSDTR